MGVSSPEGTGGVNNVGEFPPSNDATLVMPNLSPTTVTNSKLAT